MAPAHVQSNDLVVLLANPVVSGALANLTSAIATVAAGKGWAKIRSKPEGRALHSAISTAVISALRDSALPPDMPVDDEWITRVAQLWGSAFAAPSVSLALMACVADGSDLSAAHFAKLARTALADAGCDTAELDRIFWVEEFLVVLPRHVFTALREKSLLDDRVRGLVEHLLQQRGDAQADETPASPAEFRRDVLALVRRLDEDARTARLPRYQPPGKDVTALSRTVRVRQGIRTAASADVRPPELSWPDVTAQHRRLVVLGDPGMGKSWLIRTETHRLAQEALARAESDLHVGMIAIPMRCDQLADAPGKDLADKTARHLVERGLLPARSSSRLSEMVRLGEAVLLLDGLDELTPEQRRVLVSVVWTWGELTGEQARCVITSRIAGYRGSPVPRSAQVELLPLSDRDAVAVVEAWDMQPVSAAQLLDRARDPVIAAMARTPLLLALLCSLAASVTTKDGLPSQEGLPRTRGQLFERVLRWFLTQEHRSLDAPTASPLADIDIDALLEILTPLAFAFATDPAGWIDRMPGQRLIDVIRTVGPAFTERRSAASEVLRELSEELGVLVPTSDPSEGRRTDYLFFHRAMAEYLVARHLAALPEPDWADIVEQHRWFDADWTEVIPMLGEQLSPTAATRLLEHLLAADADDPLYHSLLSAVRIWGTRPDADQVLTAERSAEVTRQLVALICCRATRSATTSCLTSMAYMPQTLLIALTSLIRNDDEQTRWAVTQSLAGRKGPGVTDALLELLGDQVYEIRQAAAKALSRHDDPDVTAGMLPYLSHPDGSVQRDTAAALADQKGSAVTEALLGKLDSRDTRVGRAAGQALAHRDTPGLTQVLLERLHGTDTRTRFAVVEALATREGEEATEALIALLGDTDALMRSSAAWALAGRSGPNVVEALLSLGGDSPKIADSDLVQILGRRKEPAVTPVLLSLLGSSAHVVRIEAARALTERIDQDLAEQLTDLLASTDPHVREMAAKALAGWDEQDVTDALVGLTRDQEPSVLAAAARALAGRAGQSVTSSLVELAGHESGDVRAAAAEALTGRTGQAVTDTLLGLIHDQETLVPIAAARALADHAGHNVTQALVSMLRDKDHHVRWTAAEALEGRDEPEVTTALLRALKDSFGGVQDDAAHALANRPGAHITEGLKGMLADQDPEIRAIGAEVLAGRNDPGVTAALLRLVNDSDEQVRWAAVEALANRDDATQAFLALFKEPTARDSKDWTPVLNLAERLMFRDYRKFKPDDQSKVRTLLARLTAYAGADCSGKTSDERAAEDVENQPG